eukprot:scaffold304105_cov32-Tisochrysis_lutea.AAC.5
MSRHTHACATNTPTQICPVRCPRMGSKQELRNDEGLHVCGTHDAVIPRITPCRYSIVFVRPIMGVACLMRNNGGVRATSQLPRHCSDVCGCGLSDRREPR